MKRPTVRAKRKIVAPAARVPQGGLSEPGRVFVMGQSNANKLPHLIKESLNIRDVEHHVSKAPLNDYKVASLIKEVKGT